MKRPNRVALALTHGLSVLLMSFATLGAAIAQDDLPGRVGRLADFSGRVFLSTQEDPEDWIEALRNSTVTSGNNIFVAGDGRAEIDYGGGQIRLAEDTNVHVARLDDRIMALFVAQGRVIVRVKVLDNGEAVRIDTPNTQLALTRPGLYRIDVSDDREQTTLVVREGEATATITRGVQQVLPGQSATLSGEEPQFAEVRSGFYVDGFDSWSAERDRRYERSRSANYVSRQMIGYADLDDNGVWESNPEYGAVWYPRTVAADWAPYRYGRWTWVSGWGWTWVDDAPWGYAPFHYGRWAYVGSRWGWIPGTYVARPVWAPALVAWYGGSNWSLSVSSGAPVYGWVALGWGEPYIPWWRNCSNRCWTQYNRPYAVNYAERPRSPPTRYVNWQAPGGVTAVPGAVFTGRRPVHSNLVNVRPQTIGSAPVLAGAPAIARPSPETIRGPRAPLAGPPPAERFMRKPLEVAPARSPNWGGGNVPGSVGSGDSRAGRVAAPPAQFEGNRGPQFDGGRGQSQRENAPGPRSPLAVPGQPQGIAPTPLNGAAPAAPRESRGNAPRMAAPANPAPPTSAPSAAPGQSQNVAPSRGIHVVPPTEPPSSAQQQGIPMPRSAPPAQSAPPGQQGAPGPRAPLAAQSAPGQQQQQGIPMPRSSPPAAVAPPPQPQAAPAPRSAPPAALPPVAPQPRGMPQGNPPPQAVAPPPQQVAPAPQPQPQGGGQPQGRKPLPQEGDKPGQRNNN
ncbi:MAG TPA: DUF6600 domain-containing protein [Casimicrobiaceae bacterium]|nr:DUF6600 domain-containing protein [Casimicrobiaceae bacterium]